ncbi:dTMP kinase [Mobilitalea sibirica]|uniref:Thymidylate kinase n=1 Tax=Mobilitalea sibirica TaxID=1462919 RepID=A0A8J7H9F6_9FIRM|nr:dTMP kinase [Mobilitalea sibirica]MBH1941060.1 dTMP kinase [Mobilitalea sibirica]
MFITFDGPNGVGKTTIINEVKRAMEVDGYKIFITREPSDSNIGQFIRNSEEKYNSYTLANLVAADRHNHIKEEILPQLAKGVIVLCDRYIASSLILQVLDGLSAVEVMRINTSILKPDICFILLAKEETINYRLATRKCLTRFEREYTSKDELELSRKAADYLSTESYNVKLINTDQKLSNSVEIIKSNLLNLINGLPGG